MAAAVTCAPRVSYGAKQQIAESGERGIELAGLAIVLGWIFTCRQGIALLLMCDIFGTALLSAASRSSGL